MASQAPPDFSSAHPSASALQAQPAIWAGARVLQCPSLRKAASVCSKPRTHTGGPQPQGPSPPSGGGGTGVQGAAQGRAKPQRPTKRRGWAGPGQALCTQTRAQAPGDQDPRQEGAGRAGGTWAVLGRRLGGQAVAGRPEGDVWGWPPLAHRPPVRSQSNLSPSLSPLPSLPPEPGSQPSGHFPSPALGPGGQGPPGPGQPVPGSRERKTGKG